MIMFFQGRHNAGATVSDNVAQQFPQKYRIAYASDTLNMSYFEFCTHLPGTWLTAFRDNIPFFADHNRDKLTTLIHCFPNDFAYLRDLEKNHTATFYSLWDTVVAEPVKFCFKPICSEYNLSAAMHIISYSTWFLANDLIDISLGRLTKLKTTGLMRTYTLADINKAIDWHARLKAFLKSKGHTVFMTDMIAKALGTEVVEEDSSIEFKILLEVGLIQKTILYDQPIYALRSAAMASTVRAHFLFLLPFSSSSLCSTIQAIVDAIAGMCARFKPLSVVEDYQVSAQLTEEQLAILAQSRHMPLMVVTAPPGHGKTTVIENLMKMCVARPTPSPSLFPSPFSHVCMFILLIGTARVTRS